MLLYFTLLDTFGPIEMSFIEYVIRIRGAGRLALARSSSDARYPITGFALIVAVFVAAKWRTLRGT